MSHRVDLDDWFAEPERPRPAGEGDSWLDEPERTPPQRGLALPPRNVQLAAGAVAAVVVLLLVLWGVGVFSGSGSSQAPPAATTAPPTTTAAAPPAAPPVTAPTTTLSPGATGVQVRRLQRALVQLGYSPGKVDGAYGAATKSALESFQKAQGLQADGVLGPKTLAALTTALSAG